MLRDVLCGLDGLETWPCDEINPIWRHKNRDRGTDALMPSDATDEVIAYIRKAFEQQQRRVGSQVLVEKTCANTLRVPFVHAVFPHARFLCIVRDGREAALSAAERWTAPMDLTYTLRKLRYAPRSDVPALAMGWLGIAYGASGTHVVRCAHGGPSLKGWMKRSFRVACVRSAGSSGARASRRRRPV